MLSPFLKLQCVTQPIVETKICVPLYKEKFILSLLIEIGFQLN